MVDRQEVSVSNERNGTAPLLMLFSFVHFLRMRRYALCRACEE